MIIAIKLGNILIDIPKENPMYGWLAQRAVDRVNLPFGQDFILGLTDLELFRTTYDHIRIIKRSNELIDAINKTRIKSIW